MSDKPFFNFCVKKDLILKKNVLQYIYEDFIPRR